MWIIARLLVAICDVLSRFRSHASPRSLCSNARLMLIGTFGSDAWLSAHVRPIAAAPNCSKIWVVTDQPMAAIEKVSYICPPAVLQKYLGCTIARSVQFAVSAVATRPSIVGGFGMLCNGMLSVVVGKLIGARSIHFCVGGWAEFLGGGSFSDNRVFGRIGSPDRQIERTLLAISRRADLTLTMGTKAREFLRDKGVENVFVMSGGIDETIFRPAPISNREFDLILVARLAPIKRVDVFLKALQLVKRQKPDVRSIIVGDGPLRTLLEAQACELGIGGQVRFLGFQQDIDAWLRRSKVLVLTSDAEGLPLSVMESFMAGVPAVVSDVGDLRDLVHDARNGYLVAPGQPEEVADRACRLLSQASELAQFSRAAREAALAYTIGVASHRWADLLRGNLSPMQSARSEC